MMRSPALFALALILGTIVQASAHCRTYQAPADSEFAGQRITVNETHIGIEEPPDRESRFLGFYIDGLIRVRCEEKKHSLPMCYGIVDTGFTHLTIHRITDESVNFTLGGPFENWPAACE